MNNTIPKNNIVKEIFARIWAVWALLAFVATFLIVLLPSMASYLFKSYKQGQKYFIFLAKCWMNVWLPLVGCPLKVFGKENFKDGENYIVTFNHNALLDVPLSSPYVPGANKTIAKSSFAKIPLFGWYYTRGSVLVNRKNEKSRIESFEKMKAVLQEGMHLCIYPEGTRNRTNQPLKPFYDGAFKLAVETGKPIMPCILKGTKEAMPIHKSFYLFPHKLSMKFLPPVSSENISAKELKEKVFDIMWTEYTSTANK